MTLQAQVQMEREPAVHGAGRGNAVRTSELNAPVFPRQQLPMPLSLAFPICLMGALKTCMFSLSTCSEAPRRSVGRVSALQSIGWGLCFRERESGPSQS